MLFDLIDGRYGSELNYKKDTYIFNSISLPMTWTRIFWVKNVQRAFSRVIPGQPREQLAISKRYQAQIRKQFRLNGVPWLYDIENQTEKMNPRDKKPKSKKRELKKEVRHEKIEKALSESQQKVLEFKQQRLDNRPFGGLDRLVAKTLPSWIRKDDGAQKKKMRRRRDEDV